MKYCFDASALIHFFNEAYPKKIFPTLYEKLSPQHNERALELARKYRIKSIGQGIGQADVELISFSKIEEYTIVTEEKKQTEPPQYLSSYKIPLVCKHEGVQCINSIEFLQENEIIV